MLWSKLLVPKSVPKVGQSRPKDVSKIRLLGPKYCQNFSYLHDYLARSTVRHGVVGLYKRKIERLTNCYKKWIKLYWNEENMSPIKILKTWLGLPCWDSFAGVTLLGWLCWGGFDGAALLWQIYSGSDLDFIFSCSNKIILREKWRQQQNILPAWKWLDYGDPSYFASVRKVWKSCAKQKNSLQFQNGVKNEILDRLFFDVLQLDKYTTSFHDVNVKILTKSITIKIL